MNPSIWTPWGTRLATGLTLALVLSLGWIWVATFYLDQPTSEILSWSIADLPEQITNPERYSSLGVHFFSDFAIPIDWVETSRAMTTSPYGPGVVYLPFAILFFWPFALLPATLSLTLFVAGTLSSLLAGFWFLLRPLPPSSRLILTFLIVVATTPFIAIFDRGNIQGLIVSAVVWAVVAWRADRWNLGALAIGFACAVKGYPGILLAIPLFAGKPRAAALGLGSAAIANLIALTTLPGGITANVSGFIEATTDFASTGMLDAQVSLASAVIQWSSILGIDTTANTSIIAIASATVWLVGALWLAWKQDVPEWVGIPFLLASMQMAVPTSYSYTMSWAFLGAIWLAWSSVFGLKDTGKSQDPTVIRWMVLMALVVTLTPFAFRTVINGTVVDIQGLASPTLLAIGLLAAVIWSLRQTTIGRPQERSGVSA